MVVRVTRQAVEVLNTPDVEQTASSTLSLSQDVQVSGGKVRVTRQVVEVLSTVSELEPEVTTTLSLSQVAEQKGTVQSASNILSLTGQTQDNSEQIDIQNQLSLAQSVADNFKLASVANVLSLSDSAIPGEDKLESLTNILSLIQVATQNQNPQSVANLLNLQQDIIVVINNDIAAEVQSTLSLIQSAQNDSFIFVRSVEHGITDSVPFQLVQTVGTGGIRSISISNLLALVEQVSSNQTLNISLTSFLSLANELGRVFDESTSNILDLLQAVERVFSLSNVLNLTQTVVPFNQKVIISPILLNQVVTILVSFIRTVTTNLNLTQTVGVRFATIDTCQYDPQVGTGGISTIAPTFGTATLTLTHPFVTPTSTLILRNPNFGNTEDFVFSRINRESRGGTLLIFRDSAWPKQEVLAITIDFLKETQKASLLTFFQDSLGQEIGLLDNENRQWKGIIINPDSEVTQVGIDNYSVTFEFEGTIQ